jgi:hypothetical protein
MSVRSEMTTPILLTRGSQPKGDGSEASREEDHTQDWHLHQAVPEGSSILDFSLPATCITPTHLFPVSPSLGRSC